MACWSATAQAAINPYLAFETIEDMVAAGPDRPARRGKARRELPQGLRQGRAEGHVQDGHLDGRSYRGAQIFEAIGLSQEFVDKYFTGTVAASAASASTRSPSRWPAATSAPSRTPGERAHRQLDGGGQYQWRREGEFHLFNPETVFKLQHATRTGRYEIFKEYAAARGRPVRAPGDAARPLRVRVGDAPAGPDRGGRARRGDLQALHHRRDELRLDLGRGARERSRSP